VLSKIKLKFIDSYDDLAQYLADFHLVPRFTGNKPRILGIEMLDTYCEIASIHAGAKTLRELNILGLLNNCCKVLGDNEKAYVSMNDTQNFANENEILEKYKILLTHLPMEIIWIGVDGSTKKVKCSGVGKKIDPLITKITEEINEGLEKLNNSNNSTNSENPMIAE